MEEYMKFLNKKHYIIWKIKDKVILYFLLTIVVKMIIFKHIKSPINRVIKQEKIQISKMIFKT